MTTSTRRADLCAHGSVFWLPTLVPFNDVGLDELARLSVSVRFCVRRNSTLFLDIEHAFAIGSPFELYVLTWLKAVQAAGFRTAIYCFPAQSAWAEAHDVKLWAVHLNAQSGRKDDAGTIRWSVFVPPLPADPIDADAVGTQTRFFCHAADTGVELDYDRWLVADPSSM